MSIITQTVTTTGNGLYRGSSLQADFLRAQPSYLPDIDPRLPKHTTLASNLTSGANATITVSNIAIFADANVSAGIRGAVRIVQEVITYNNRWVANSTLTGLTRNIAGTPSCTISGNVLTGNLVSSLGIRVG